MIQQWDKILLIKLRAIGDVILATPVIQNLRLQFPSAQIDFLVEKASAPLLLSNPELSAVFISPAAKEQSFLQNIRFLKALRRQQYDVVIDLFGNPRSAWITLLCGAKQRVGFDFRGRKYAYHIRIPSRASHLHEVEFNLDALRYFDIPIKAAQPKIYLNAADVEKAKKIKENVHRTDFPFIALNPAGSWQAKRWLPQFFIDLGHLLQKDLQATLLILWGPGEYELAKNTADQIGGGATIHPKTDLMEQAALLSLCDLFIGNDSGPMHLAAAVGIPTIGIFGPTNAKLQGPYGPNTKAVYHAEIPCLGCDRLTCPILDCMTYLKPEMILEHALTLLQSRQTKRVAIEN